LTLRRDGKVGVVDALLAMERRCCRKRRPNRRRQEICCDGGVWFCPALTLKGSENPLTVNAVDPDAANGVML